MESVRGLPAHNGLNTPAGADDRFHRRSTGDHYAENPAANSRPVEQTQQKFLWTLITGVLENLVLCYGL